jgi:hypothetical protein
MASIAGICTHQRPGSKLFGIATQVVGALAGQAADRKFFGVPYTDDPQLVDYRNACRAAVKLTRRYGVGLDRVLRFGRLAALELVCRYTRQIEKLADALIKRDILNESQIEDIVGDVEQIHTAPLIGMLVDATQRRPGFSKTAVGFAGLPQIESTRPERSKSVQL